MVRSLSMIAGSWVLAGVLGGCGGDSGFAPSAEPLGRTEEAYTLPKPITIPTVILQKAPADLQPFGFLLYHFHATGPKRGLDIQVKNVGQSTVIGASGSVMVDGVVVTGATLHQLEGPAPAQGQFALDPGKTGFIHIEVPPTLIGPCTYYDVQIDFAHSMQSGPPTVFDNDTANLSTICALRWSQPITARELGHDPDPALAGKPLYEIVSSFVSGRPDGKRCSNCHFNASSGPYSPELVPKDGLGPHLPPSSLVDGRTWEGEENSWGLRFLLNQNFPHTEPLREAIGKWRSDGQLF
jgi:hypothetical protein